MLIAVRPSTLCKACAAKVSADLTSKNTARPRGRPRGAGEQSELGVSERMVQLEGESLNALFETLEDWGECLNKENVDFSDVSHNEAETHRHHPIRRGPSL